MWLVERIDSAYPGARHSSSSRSVFGFRGGPGRRSRVLWTGLRSFTRSEVRLLAHPFPVVDGAIQTAGRDAGIQWVVPIPGRGTGGFIRGGVMEYVLALLLIAAVVTVDSYAVIRWRRKHRNEHGFPRSRGLYR